MPIDLISVAELKTICLTCYLEMNWSPTYAPRFMFYQFLIRFFSKGSTTTIRSHRISTHVSNLQPPPPQHKKYNMFSANTFDLIVLTVTDLKMLLKKIVNINWIISIIPKWPSPVDLHWFHSDLLQWLPFCHLFEFYYEKMRFLKNVLFYTCIQSINDKIATHFNTSYILSQCSCNVSGIRYLNNFSWFFSILF